MGGRGSSFGGASTKAPPIPINNGIKDGTFVSTELTEIENLYRKAYHGSPSYWKKEVLEAESDGQGNLTFRYASDGDWDESASTNRTSYVTYHILAGAVNGDSFNIDWDNVNSISGRTYSMRREAKAAGLKWDPSTKTWRR